MEGRKKEERGLVKIKFIKLKRKGKKKKKKKKKLQQHHLNYKLSSNPTSPRILI